MELTQQGLRSLVYKAEQLVSASEKRSVEIIRDLWVGKPLEVSKDHHKLDERSWRFSLAPLFSCPAECLAEGGCAEDCYAISDENLYKGAWNKDISYSFMALTDLDRLFRLLNDQIFRFRDKYGANVRIHERGDFFSQQYLNMWAELGISHDIPFYCFTKRRKPNGDSEFNWWRYDNAPNTVWHSSYLPDGQYNFGTEEWVKDMHSTYPSDTYVCPFYMNHKKCGLCSGSCSLCLSQRLNGKTPLFVIHKKN